MTQTTTDNQVSSISEIRRERERAEMTERIMDVARAMFVQDGYEAVTLRKIALAIEYSPGAIYQYFKDKQALIRAIIQKDQQDLRTQIMESMLIEEPGTTDRNGAPLCPVGHIPSKSLPIAARASFQLGQGRK